MTVDKTPAVFTYHTMQSLGKVDWSNGFSLFPQTDFFFVAVQLS